MRSCLFLALCVLACSREPAPPPPAAPAPPRATAPAAPAEPTPAQKAQQAVAAALSGEGTVTVSDGFVVVPPGRFVMGVPPGETDEGDPDAPPHPVVITRPFEMQATEVTEAQFAQLIAAQPAQRSGCAACPVVNVSWFQAVAWCNQLSARKNLPACYVLAGTDVQFKGLACRGYRLPTEAEWEYAARAGTTGPRYGTTDAVAWIDVNSGLQPHPVGGKQPNPWGLHDMLGNAFEWTQDWQGDYPAGEVTDPVGPPTATNKVFRGGSFKHPDTEARAGFRNGYGPGNQVEFIGFRCVRTLGK